MAQVEGDEAPGGVQDVDGRGVAAVGVADGVGQDGGQPLLDGQAEQAGGVGGGELVAVGTAVGGDLDEEVLAPDHLPPPAHDVAGDVRSPAPQRPAELGGRSEQDEQSPVAGVLGDEVQRGHRPAALPAQVGGADQPAQRGPASLVLSEQGDPRVTQVHGASAAGGGTSVGTGARVSGPAPGAGGAAGAGPSRQRTGAGLGEQPGVLRGRLDREVDPEHGPDTNGLAGDHELHGAVHPVPVGQREGVHAVVERAPDQRVRVGGAVAQ